MKIKKKLGGSGWGGGVSVVVGEELKFLGKIKKKKFGGGGRRGVRWGGVRVGGGSGWM